MKPMKQIVFDAHAILKWTQKEQGYKKVKSLMVACREGSVTGYMNQINVGEVYYKSIRVLGHEQARSFLENFYRLPINFILPDQELVWKASEIKAAYPISYADCFAAATALKCEAPILTGDPEFRKLGNLICLEWIS
jgi:predicted nucleic acid-binding protein